MIELSPTWSEEAITLFFTLGITQISTLEVMEDLGKALKFSISRLKLAKKINCTRLMSQKSAD